MKQTLSDIFNKKKVLVTGGLGSIGSENVHQLINFNVERLIILDNRETELYYTRLKYKSDNRIESFLCDIRDKSHS